MTIRVQEGLGPSFLLGKEKKWVYVPPDRLLEGLKIYLSELESQIGNGEGYKHWRKVKELLQERLQDSTPAASPEKEIGAWQKLINHAGKVSDLFIWLKIPQLVLDESD